MLVSIWVFSMHLHSEISQVNYKIHMRIIKIINFCFANAGPKGMGKRKFEKDNCPCQNSKLAKEALEGIECSVHRMPARSPDLNPIENVFHIVKQRLDIRKRKTAHRKRII